MLLAETGLRLGEALGLQHRDWHAGRGDTPFIEVVPREHPHGVRAKGGRYRRLFISDALDQLYGEYLWQLCDAGADLAVPDLDAAHVFVNLAGGTRFAPWRSESVYDLVGRLRRELAGEVPEAWTPHWLRHSHATALLLAGVPVHVVSRRLGHADVQTTLNLYAHVTEEADMRAVAEWKSFSAGWRAVTPDRRVLVTGTAADDQEFLEAAVAAHRAVILDAMWDTVPAALRPARISLDGLPAEYAGAFTRSRTHGFTIDLTGLPQTLQRELSWCMSRIIGRGGKITVGNMAIFTRWLGVIIEDSPPAVHSLTGLGPGEWLRRFPLAMQRHRGHLPAPSTVENFRQHLLSCFRLLRHAYDPRPWWQHEVWDPAIDQRIVLRHHEPCGRRAAHFDGIVTGWLRAGMQWHCRVSLETGAMTWTTVLGRISGMKVFDEFCRDQQITSPRLADDPAQVRALMLDYLSHVRSLAVSTNRPTRGQPLSSSRLIGLMAHPEQFYAFMHDNRDAAAVALAEPGWRLLGMEHLVFFRPGERPRRQPRATVELDVIDDAAFSQIMNGIGILGAPESEGGLGDEQAMRILLLLALTGRRLNEICMLDRDPLHALPQAAPDAGPGPGAFIARLRYQQTKIEGSPDTILVDAEVVAVIKAQQEWAARHFAARGAAGRIPRYLFLAEKVNRNGDRPYPGQRLRDKLNTLAARLDIRDAAGRLVDFNRTHRFRHTKGTTLLNAWLESRQFRGHFHYAAFGVQLSNWRS